ncbi:hypothetical protein GCM10009555_059010 [Acrocarpospora macrocephala]|uniref:Uncharacterized protein n=1 Tax=Acrocarpospora macrocephala TaxID=150177 RepID=A0A5M3WSM1_9ACTN|nr:hypothetical protein [Acrocarpospora macrocephala]GES11874.1 hypothetical protein Amac_054710 [Acrocarpospora macrocephala]
MGLTETDLSLPLGAARYRWGSLIVFFKGAPVRNQTLFQELQHESFGQFAWQSNAEVRESLAFMHEIVHYQQDLGTGVGHWDDNVRRRHIPDCLLSLRVPVSRTDLAFPFARHDEDEATNGDLEYAWFVYEDFLLEKLIFLHNSDVPASRHQKIAAILALELGVEVQPEQYEFLLPESILEGEAAATVYGTILASQATAEARELIYAHSGMWDIFEMNPAPVYQATMQAFVGGYPDLPDDPDWQPRSAFDLFTFLIDLSCAHPCPEWFEKHGVDRTNFEPGVKFFRLARALAGLDLTGRRAIEHAFSSDDLEAAEDVLLERISFDYPKAREIYAGWVEHYTNDNHRGDNRVLATRLASARYRAEVKPIIARKSVMEATMAGIPVLLHGAQGGHQVWFGDTIIQPTEQTMLQVDAALDAVHYELVTAMLDSGRFRCPLATRSLCGSAQNTCRHGIDNLRLLPEAPGCHVRVQLEVNGFNILQ